MAETFTDRFGLRIWGEDTDGPTRVEFNEIHERIEELAAMFMIGPGGDRPPPEDYPGMFYYATDSTAALPLSFSNGVAWRNMDASTKIELFLTSATFTKDTLGSAWHVVLVGGGGGGAGGGALILPGDAGDPYPYVNYQPKTRGGGGGGGGGICYRGGALPAQIPSSAAITIGAGGAGGVGGLNEWENVWSGVAGDYEFGTDGADGGTTSFGTLWRATGGAKGLATGNGGAGGVGSNNTGPNTADTVNGTGGAGGRSGISGTDDSPAGSDSGELQAASGARSSVVLRDRSYYTCGGGGGGLSPRIYWSGSQPAPYGSWPDNSVENGQGGRGGGGGSGSGTGGSGSRYRFRAASAAGGSGAAASGSSGNGGGGTGSTWQGNAGLGGTGGRGCGGGGGGPTTRLDEDNGLWTNEDVGVNPALNHIDAVGGYGGDGGAGWAVVITEF